MSVQAHKLSVTVCHSDEGCKQSHKTYSNDMVQFHSKGKKIPVKKKLFYRIDRYMSIITYSCMQLGHLTPPKSRWQGNEVSDALPPNSTLLSIPASPLTQTLPAYQKAGGRSCDLTRCPQRWGSEWLENKMSSI